MGLTAFDTGVLVAFFDGADPFHDGAVTQVAQASGGEMIVPAVAYSELSVGFQLAGSPPAFLDEILAGLRIRVGHLDQAVAAMAARLRASTLRDRRRRQWRMPDAMVAAEATLRNADRLITTDARWPSWDGSPEVIVVATAA